MVLVEESCLWRTDAFNGFLGAIIITVLLPVCILLSYFEPDFLPNYSTNTQSIRDWTDVEYYPMIPCHNKSLNISTQKRRPVEHFVYHALHKTASGFVRKLLMNYCVKNRLKCFGPATFCGDRVEVCNRQLEQKINFGTFTPKRIKKCCKRLTEKTMLNGFIDHYQMNIPNASEFLDNHTEVNAFRFTFVRPPEDQFYSYFHNLQKYQHLTKVGLEPLVTSLHQHRHLTGDSLPYELRLWRNILTNSQSKELGWDGYSEGSLNSTLRYVQQLDFVAPTDRYIPSLREIRKRLGWSEKEFPLPRTLKLPRHPFPKEMTTKVQEIQFADMMLYKQVTRQFMSNCI